MPVSLRRGRVTALVEQHPGLVRLEVDGTPCVGYPDVTGPVEVGDDVLVNVQARELGLGSGGFDVLHANLNRYRRYNEELRAAGLAQDQKEKIEALTKAVEELPVEGAGFKAFKGAGPASLVLIGALVLATGALGWIAVERGRRLASLQRPGSRPVALVAAEVHRTDVDSKAV